MMARIHIAALAAAPLWLLPAVVLGSDNPPESHDPPRGTAQLTLDDLRTFTDVFNQVRRNYVEEVDDHTLLDSALRGMLLELDPHSDYIPGPDYQDFEDSSQGRYSGIGVDVQGRNGQIVVRAVINGSPADAAGINPQDVITAVDNVPVEDERLQEAIDGLAGEPGTQVSLELRTADGERRTLTLQREYLQIPVLSFELLERDWGYYRISLFHTQSATDFRKSLKSLAADGIQLRGLVIDLRNNPGGVLQGAVEMADGFLDEGLIVTTRGRNATMQMEFRAQPGQWLPGIPVLLLVDRGSASASEVMAGALQDHGRALIVGERTFGKGSVQSVLPLRNGGGLKLTTARYYTPSGRSIQAQGIDPDVPYDNGGSAGADTGRTREADLEGHLDREATSAVVDDSDSVGLKADFPLQEALEVLEAAGILTTEQQ